MKFIWLTCNYASLCIALNACGDLVPATDAASGSGIDAPPQASCSPSAPFGAWVTLQLEIPGLIMPFFGGQPSADELTFYFSANSAMPADFNIYTRRRATTSEPFGEPVLLASQNTTDYEGDVSISADGLSLWFLRGTSPLKILAATRSNLLGEFGPAAVVTGVDSSSSNAQPFLTADNKELWFTSDRNGNGKYDVWSAKATVSGFLPPQLEPALNVDGPFYLPRLSFDKRTLYASVERTDGRGFDVFRSQRSTVDDGFPRPTPVAELNTAGNDFVSWISADNCRVYGSSQGMASFATRQP